MRKLHRRPRGPATARPVGAPRRGAAVTGLALDIGLPLASYYTLHALGASDWVALLAGTGAAGVRVGWMAVWNRRLTWFATIMLAVFGAGLALAFLGGDARLLLLKDSVPTAMVGMMFLASLLGRRPLTLSAAQTWRPGYSGALDELYRTEPAARRAFRLSALAWGAGLLAEAALRVPLVSLLPIDAAVGLSTAWMITAMVALGVWNAAYITHAARREPALLLLLPVTTAHHAVPTPHQRTGAP